uniref:TFIIS N-terminal domain-containing protein n=1 Tax=Oryza meridionalis TaxID=40149 RepID=A0A0E0DVY7_9ORYZ
MEMAAPGRGDDLEELIARLVDVTVDALMIWRRCSTTVARRSPRAAWRGRRSGWCGSPAGKE